MTGVVIVAGRGGVGGGGGGEEGGGGARGGEEEEQHQQQQRFQQFPMQTRINLERMYLKNSLGCYTDSLTLPAFFARTLDFLMMQLLPKEYLLRLKLPPISPSVSKLQHPPAPSKTLRAQKSTDVSFCSIQGSIPSAGPASSSTLQ